MRTYRVRAMPLTSAPVPPLRDDEHVRGPAGAPLVVLYADFTCPYCAVAQLRLRRLALRVAFRHFALKAKHPRALALAHASEAAAAQGAFWPFHDAVYADQGRLDDPHLWRHAEGLGLDVGRFDVDRRAEDARQRVRRDVREAMRAGVGATPTLVGPDGLLRSGAPEEAWLATLSSSGFG
jgi:protein-disulfide isomerase